MTTKQRNIRRKIEKRATMKTDSGIQSDSGSYIWKRFDTMIYKRSVAKNN